MRQLISSLMCFGLTLVATGCPGSTIDNLDPDGGGGGDDAPAVDAGPVDMGQKLSGKTMDYFLANTPLDTITLSSDGIQPAMMTVSAVGGAYELLGVPTGSKVYFTADKAGGLWRPTRNAAVTVEGAAVMADLYIMTKQDVAVQYASTGNAITAGKAFLAAELQKPDGTPLSGVLLTGITLVDALDVPVPGIKGPFVFGSAGSLDPALTTTTTVNGKARIGFLDVPPGQYTLKVIYQNTQLVDQTVLTPVIFAADGATIALAKGLGGGGGGGAITNPTFTANIYPKLQKAVAGGLGCANCHTANGTAGGVLKFDDPATLTLTNMKARLGVIDLTTPALSLLLTKPLYEPAPANHPNATFLDINDPDYKLFLLWITQGALP